MRNFKTTIIALVVLIVAIVVFICVKSFIGKDSEPDETDATSTSVSIFNIDTEKVTKVRALNEEEFSLYKTEDIWHCNSHLDMEVYSESVEDIIDDFASLKAFDAAPFESAPTSSAVYVGFVAALAHEYTSLAGKEDGLFLI